MSSLPFVWDDLQFFLTVARTGQLSRAARQIKTSHVTVARRIERLESALNARLFERSPKGYEMTAAGLRLLAMAEKMEQDTDRLREQIAGSGQALRGMIRLNMPEGFSHFFCTRMIGEFTSRFPGITLELVSIQQIMSLSRKVSDIAVMLDPPKAGPYWAEKITDYTLHLYASPGYIAASPPIRGRDDLVAHPFIGYIDEMIFAPGLDYMSDVHPSVRARFQSSSIFSQLSAARAGLGIVVLPHFIGGQARDLVSVLPDEVALTRHYWMACHRDMREIPRERAVIEFMMGAVRARAGELNRLPGAVGRTDAA